MTGFLNFTKDSFKKRKELQHLFLIQVLIATILYYLIIIADILVVTFYSSSASNLLNASVSNYWGAFFLILTVIALVFTIAIILFTLRLMIFYQVKDISIMIGIGGLIETIENFFLVQLVLMCLIANLVGIITAYFVSFVVILLSSIIFPFQSALRIAIPDYQVIIVFIILFFSTYLLSAKLVSSLMKKSFEDLQNDKVDFNEGNDNNFLARIFIWGKKSKDGFIDIKTRIARLNIMRYSFVFIISLIINLFYAFFLISLVFGTIVVSDTASNVMMTGTGGENTAIIVKNGFEMFFKDSLLIDSNFNISDVNLQNSFFSFQSLLPILQSHNITNVDERIILTKEILASNPTQNIDPNDPVNTGNDPGSLRRGIVFTIGINPLKAIPKWNYYGNNPVNISSNSVFVGEKLAWEKFTNPIEGKLYFSEKTISTFTVKSIILDPMFKGNTLYMDLFYLQSFFNLNENNRNLIFISYSSVEILNQIENELQNSTLNLSIIPLNSVIKHNTDFNFVFSIFLMFIGIPLLIAYFYISNSYSEQILRERLAQLNIIKILGGNKDSFISIILKEIDGFSFWGLLIGYVLAMYFIVEMTIPFPIVSTLSLIISMIIIIIPYFINRRLFKQRILVQYDCFIID